MAQILVADDDATFRLFLRTVLEEGGHEVGFANDGEQAVEFFLHGAFDLLILDVILPKLNGAQVIRDIKAGDPGAKIVAVSGDLAQLEYAEAAGALVCLAKPLKAEDVIETIDRLLRRTTGWQGVTD